MAVFDTAEANRLLDAAFSTADYVGATTGSQLRLCTATGTDAAAGTLVTGGSYAHQAMTMAAAASRSASNTGTISFTGITIVTAAADSNVCWTTALVANKRITITCRRTPVRAGTSARLR